MSVLSDAIVEGLYEDVREAKVDSMSHEEKTARWLSKAATIHQYLAMLQTEMTRNLPPENEALEFITDAFLNVGHARKVLLDGGSDLIHIYGSRESD